MKQVTLPYKDSIRRAWNAGGKELTIASAFLVLGGNVLGYSYSDLFLNNLGTGYAAEQTRILGQVVAPVLSLILSCTFAVKACIKADRRLPGNDPR